MHNNINLSLNTAINQLPHASFEYIASAPIEKMHEHDFITRQNVSTSPKRKSLHRLAYSLACFALIFISGFEIFLQNFAVDSLITIDVNPSFEITTNRREHVLNVKALNTDAEDFLADKDFHGMTVDDAIETLFLELSASPYMTTEKNTILLSVRNKDTSYSTRLEQELAEHIEKALAATPIKPHIVCQPLLSDKKSQSEAQQYHISPGKLQLAYEIKEKFPSYSIAELAAMPLEELLTLGSIKSNKSNDDFELHEPTFLTKDADDTDDLDDLDSNDDDVDGTDSDDDDTDDTDDDMDIDKDDKNDSDNENHIDAVKPHNKNNAGLQKPSDKNDDDAPEQIEPPENDNDTTEQSDEAILESENDNDITEPPDEVLSEPENDNDADNSEPIESLSSEQDSPTNQSESTESAPSENHSNAKDSQLSVDNAPDVSTDSGDNSSDSQSTESSDNSSDFQSTDSGDNSSDSESTEP